MLYAFGRIILLIDYPGGGKLLREDLARYKEGFFYLMTFEPTFRNLFYARLGVKSFPLMLLLPRDKSLRIDHMMKLGGGCRLVHSYWTYIHAQSIGKNFSCLHNVTIRVILLVFTHLYDVE